MNRILVCGKVLWGRMDLTQVQECLDGTAVSVSSNCESHSVSLETEIPEALYRGMKDFIRINPQWDQYKLISSALANFLFQNGCNDRAVTEIYLNDLFTRVEA